VRALANSAEITTAAINSRQISLFVTNMSEMTPREIVQELDKHIIEQDATKRTMTITLHNR